MRFKLIFNDFTLSSEQTIGGVTYNQTVNADTDLCYGCASMSEIAFSFRNDLIAAETIFEGQTLTLEVSQTENTSAYISFGIYTVIDVLTAMGKTTVKAYDNMKKFDKVIDTWLSGLTYPITAYNMLSSLCTYCGVVIGSPSIINGSFNVAKNFSSTEITGRIVLGYIAELAASFSVIGTDGKLYFRQYTTSAISIGKTDYVKCTKAEYKTDKINKVQIRSTDNDVGVSAGTGSNVWIVQNNPMLYAENANEIQSVVDILLKSVANIEYTPMVVELFSDKGINVGDIINIDDVPTLVMSKLMKSSGVTLTSSGNKKRSVQSSVINQVIQRLRGQITEINIVTGKISTRLGTAEGDISTLQQTATSLTSTIQTANGNISTLQQTVSTLSSKITTAEGNISTLQQTATSLTSTIQTANGNISTLQQTVSTLSSKITSAEGDISSLGQTANSLTSSISAANGNISTLQQTSNNLTYRVSNAENNILSVSYTADKVNWLISSGTDSSNFQMTSRAIDLVAANINLTGFVTFASLGGNGTTSINGSNITSGTISADRIGANNSGHITFNAPMLLSSTYPNISGINTLTFNANTYITDSGDPNGNQPLTMYSYCGVQFLGGTPTFKSGNNIYTIIHTGNVSNYMTARFG